VRVVIIRKRVVNGDYYCMGSRRDQGRDLIDLATLHMGKSDFASLLRKLNNTLVGK
jgi:hypothetical protein